MYKFDFTNDAEKIYSKTLPRQTSCAEQRAVEFMRFFKVGDDNLRFTDFQGYGFEGGENIAIVRRDEPDGLRRDFASGGCDTEFVIEAPRGQYELFVVSGDEDEDSVTLLEAVNGLKPKCTLTKKGEYQCKTIPLIVEDGENIRLKVSTQSGYRWKINFMLLNGVKGY